MKIAIMGTGGLGGYFGGCLAKAGEEVTFIARGENLAALRGRGLRVKSAIVEDFALPPVNATDDPAQVGPVELVVMCVKAYGLEEAARAIAPMLGPETVVVPVLNGVDIAERIGAVVGMGHMLDGLTFTSAQRTGPGEFRHQALNQIAFGEPAGGLSPRGEAVQAAFRRAGVEADLSGDIRTDIWSKFAVVVPFGGVSAVTRLSGKAMAENPPVLALMIDAMEEVAALAAAQGYAVDREAMAKLPLMLKNWPPEAKNSLLVDLERGNPLEVESLQGAVVRLAEPLGVPTPLCRLIYAALKPHAAGAGVS